jgi:hypothetical protein
MVQSLLQTKTDADSGAVGLSSREAGDSVITSVASMLVMATIIETIDADVRATADGPRGPGSASWI